ncbi:small ribosomal subunit protein mS40 isoform X2 [Phymastichus coffea]|uniref:small ribosomal subunit protein mS40 isoform X2 n=1 Tax=Phymastichus coffea TaxID=108790 RepID=UPI00273B31C1|nr:small ribosomal subunit protein mS40 isoform X2 [Phymastichus coffea]
METIQYTLHMIGREFSKLEVIAARRFSQSLARCSEKTQEKEVEGEHQSENGTEEQEKLHPMVDRTKVIPLETSIKYLQSDAYKITYGNDPVWKYYRRNHKGQFAPNKTRKTCIRSGVISTSNPCPICRDEYLVIDYRNVDLLKQFISPYNGETISYEKTGLCQFQHKMLRVAIYKAKDYGTISYDVPFRKYDYSEWYDQYSEAKNKE